MFRLFTWWPTIQTPFLPNSATQSQMEADVAQRTQNKTLCNEITIVFLPYMHLQRLCVAWGVWLHWFPRDQWADTKDVHLLFHSSEAAHRTDFTPTYFERFISIIWIIKHQWAPIDTSIRAAATSVFPLSHHLFILNLNTPVLPASEKGNLTQKGWQGRQVCVKISNWS